MSQLINIGSEYINLKDDNTFTRHKVKILQQGQHILRVDTDALGKETPSFIAPKVLLTTDKTTGDIIQEQRGFVIDHEILGVPKHPDADKEFHEIPEVDFPADYSTEDPVTKAKIINYRYDKITNKLKKKV